MPKSEITYNFTTDILYCLVVGLNCEKINNSYRQKVEKGERKWMID